MALQVKGGHDGIAIFEMDQFVMANLVCTLVISSVSFYCEPWSDGLYHITVNGAARAHVAQMLKDADHKFRPVWPRP